MTTTEYNRINKMSLKDLRTLPDNLFYSWINTKEPKLRDGVKRFLGRTKDLKRIAA